MRTVLKCLAFIVGTAGALTNLPAMVVGLSILGCSIRLHTSESPYFQYGYFFTALVCMLLSALGLTMAGMAIGRRRSYLLPAVVSLGLGLACMIELPEVGPRLDMAGAATRLLGHADHSLSDWDETHHSFPSNEQELRQALALRPLHEPAIFFFRSKPISYEVSFVPNATAPAIEPLPPNPGTVVYAVSSDYKEYWLTITTLQNPVGGPVVMLHVSGDYERGKLWVFNRKHRNPGDGYQPFIE